MPRGRVYFPSDRVCLSFLEGCKYNVFVVKLSHYNVQRLQYYSSTNRIWAVKAYILRVNLSALLLKQYFLSKFWCLIFLETGSRKVHKCFSISPKEYHSILYEKRDQPRPRLRPLVREVLGLLVWLSVVAY